MIRLGMFTPGVTPNGTILEHWPGFLIGGAVGGFLLASIARRVMASMGED